MNIFIVKAHPEPKSFCSSLFNFAVTSLSAAGNEVRTTDLYEAGFNPISDRRNFTSVKNPDYLKLQIEEMHASKKVRLPPNLKRKWKRWSGVT